MKKKLLIFDLDGTLINTLKDLNASTNFALKKFNYPLRTLEQTRCDIGNGVAMLIARSIPKGISNPDYPEVLRIFREHYIHHYLDNSLPYPEVKNVVEELKRQGFLLAVVSNKFDEGAKKLVSFYFPNLFDRIQGALPNLNNKPSNDLVNKVLNELNIKNLQEVLYIGDTEVDFQTAVNSQIDCVLVSYGYRTETQLKDKIKNPPIISSLGELLNSSYLQ